MNNQSFTNYSPYNSLPRSSSSMASTISTPTSTSTNRTLPPRAGFGTNNYVLKDDYEKERSRWQKDLAEAEAKLSQLTAVSTDLAQAKAQLNKKLIDIEKNQKPMVDCNRRLAERNKTLMDSCKNLEDTLSFVKDEKLTLKDQYDRIVKENSSLREQRAFPEKLEELERYRTQVLEYSKCITALRQSLVEKDRRYELLIQKLRKIKKALSVRNKDRDDDEQSVGSSIALDTITEDFDEDTPLIASGDIQPTIYEQLEIATTTLNELRTVLDLDDDKSTCILSKVVKLQEDYGKLNEKHHILELELANAHDTSDLLEFQLVELTSTKTQHSFVDQSCETEELLPETDTAAQDDDSEIERKLSFTGDFIQTAKDSLYRLSRLFVLSPEHKQAIRNGATCISGLEHKLSFAQQQLNMAQCEIERVNKLAEDNAAELREAATSSQKKKELKATIERMKTEADKRMTDLKSLERDNEVVRHQLEQLQMEKEIFRQSLEESTDKINAVVESLQNSNQLVEDYKQRIKSSNEQIEIREERIRQLEAELREAGSFKTPTTEIEVELARLCIEMTSTVGGDELTRNTRVNQSIQNGSINQLAEIRRRLCNYEEVLQSANTRQKELEKKMEADSREVQQLRKYNKQLEAQFESQMDIIIELKKRYLDLNAKSTENSKSRESISWTSSGSSDDHNDETRSEEAYDGVFPKKIIA